MSFYRNVYLKSEDWKNLRAAVISDHCPDSRCEFCGRGVSKFDVHHFDYRQLFNVVAEDLAAICRICHNLAHEILAAHPEWAGLHPRERRRFFLREFFKEQSPLELLWRRCYRKVRLYSRNLARSVRHGRKLEKYLALYFRLGFDLDEQRSTP